MLQSASTESPKRRWLTLIAPIAGLLLGETVLATPAYSGEFGYRPAAYPYDCCRYAPAPYYEGAGYRSGCGSCGCSRCGCGWRCDCGRCGVSVAPRGHVVERRYVEREYYERRYVAGGYRSHAWYSGPQGSTGPVPYGYGYGESRYAPFPYGYGGVRYAPPPFGYQDPPRPPALVPGAYPYDDYPG
jgi:hypothetical protein